MKPKKRRSAIRKVTLSLDDLALLCLNVDYRMPSGLKDKVEELSIKLQKRFRFDTYEWRMSKGLSLQELNAASEGGRGNEDDTASKN